VLGRQHAMGRERQHAMGWAILRYHCRRATELKAWLTESSDMDICAGSGLDMYVERCKRVGHGERHRKHLNPCYDRDGIEGCQCSLPRLSWRAALTRFCLRAGNTKSN
jgi:hypothetical protein